MKERKFKIIKNVKFYPDGSIASFDLDRPIETKEDDEKFLSDMGWK